MSFLDNVRAERQGLANVLKQYSGIRRIVEDLYPDRAHFLYELLQNAEDVGATEACFDLDGSAIRFKHDGRSFTENDVKAITNIGEGTKGNDDDQIGRFGIGFKAVFAYTETPHIWSPTFSFKITDLVLPWAIGAKPKIGQETCFEFPFNNLKKPAQEAFAEISSGFSELAETTLLFLNSLQTIRWQISGIAIGEVRRVKHSVNHVEITKTVSGVKSAYHFLHFSEPVKGMDTEKQRVAIAFELERLTPSMQVIPEQSLSAQLKLVSAECGRVAVSFPAEKELSGLRFHLHAPFVPELSRASVKDTPANSPLFQQLADLCAASLHTIRDLNLLNGDFLGILPNYHDNIPPRYQSIRTRLLEEMSNHPLTPTHLKSHAPARHLLKARAALKELLSPEDLGCLVDFDETTPQWSIGATQRNNSTDRFLEALAIKEWDVAALVERLQEKAVVTKWSSPDAAFVRWMSAKSFEWHQQLYALLREDMPANQEYRRRYVERFKDLQIVILSNGKYSVARNCYFPSPDAKDGDILPRVAKESYSTGKSRTQQEGAKSFLEEIGVREAGKVELVQAILEKRYASTTPRVEAGDLEKFVSLVESDVRNARLFRDYHVFHLANGAWGKPIQAYLDMPFVDTGLTAYYGRLGVKANKAALSPKYATGTVSLVRFWEFAKCVGVTTRLEIILASCKGNPARHELIGKAKGQWSDKHGLDRDYTIQGIENLLSHPCERFSQLIWKTACEKEDIHWLRAQYRNNSLQEPLEAPSQLVCILRDSAWVPQRDGRFVRPSEASQISLPSTGFPFEEGYHWLKAIQFGAGDRLRSEEHKKQQATAKALGFPDAECLERAKRFASLPQFEQERVLADFERRNSLEMPDQVPRDPERRAGIVESQAVVAQERIAEMRSRSVSIGREEVKEEAAQYLRQLYTNRDGMMICQICGDELPFKLDDGNYYFEKVEFISELNRRHHQNYLALCPLHSAMFQHANSSKDLLKRLFANIEGKTLEIVLAQAEAKVYFSQTHLADLHTVIAADDKK